MEAPVFYEKSVHFYETVISSLVKTLSVSTKFYRRIAKCGWWTV